MIAEGALRGSFTPLVTPFRHGEVDYEAFEALVERQVAGGSDGVVVTGTTGEPTSLSVAERAALYMRAVDASAGRLQVVAAIGTPNREETLRLARGAEAAQVDALLVVSPAFVTPSQRGLAQHFTDVARATELPVLIYNIPGRAAVSVEVETLAAAADASPNVVGVKHASADLDYVTDALTMLGEEFRIFCGAESLSYPMLAVGAAGLMSAVGNLFPVAVAKLCEAVAAGDHRLALALHRELFAVNRAVFYDTNPVPLKAMLELLGVASSDVRSPLVSLDYETQAKVERVLARYERHVHDWVERRPGVMQS